MDRLLLQGTCLEGVLLPKDATQLTERIRSQISGELQKSQLFRWIHHFPLHFAETSEKVLPPFSSISSTTSAFSFLFIIFPAFSQHFTAVDLQCPSRFQVLLGEASPSNGHCHGTSPIGAQTSPRHGKIDMGFSGYHFQGSRIVKRTSTLQSSNMACWKIHSLDSLIFLARNLYLQGFSSQPCLITGG